MLIIMGRCQERHNSLRLCVYVDFAGVDALIVEGGCTKDYIYIYTYIYIYIYIRLYTYIHKNGTTLVLEGGCTKDCVYIYIYIYTHTYISST